MRCAQVLPGDAVSAFGGAGADHAMPRARSGSAHTASEPTGQTHQLLIVPAVCVGRCWRGVPTLTWLNVFMEVHMRIKVYMHMAG
jgi:hypothetical protein